MAGKGRCEGQRAAVQPDTQPGDGWWRWSVKTNECQPSAFCPGCAVWLTPAQSDTGKTCGRQQFPAEKVQCGAKNWLFNSMLFSKCVSTNFSQMKSAVPPWLLLLLHYAESDISNMDRRKLPFVMSQRVALPLQQIWLRRLFLLPNTGEVQKSVKTRGWQGCYLSI